jgi:hypothetical protein
MHHDGNIIAVVQGGPHTAIQEIFRTFVARWQFSARIVGVIAQGVPVLTAVSPAFAERWAQFAAPLFTALPADPVAIDAWWCEARGVAPATPPVARVSV